MKYEEIMEILERVRNGEKAEDLIDFTAPTRSGEITPGDAFSLCMDNIYCKDCGKKLKGKEMWYCEDCVNKSQEHFSQTVFGREYKKDDNWSYAMGLLLLAGIFSNDGKKENNDE